MLAVARTCPLRLRQREASATTNPGHATTGEHMHNLRHTDSADTGHMLHVRLFVCECPRMIAHTRTPMITILMVNCTCTRVPRLACVCSCYFAPGRGDRERARADRRRPAVIKRSNVGFRESRHRHRRRPANHLVHDDLDGETAAVRFLRVFARTITFKIDRKYVRRA